eukprot:g1022.t1
MPCGDLNSYLNLETVTNSEHTPWQGHSYTHIIFQPEYLSFYSIKIYRFEGEECFEQKSRVAAKGFQQRKCIDCAHLLEAGDAEFAFLKAKRDTPVYLRMLVEYIPKDHYLDAWAGVNGLRDSGHLYHTRCLLPLYEIGLKANLHDECLFMCIDPKTKTTVLAVTHVDDYALAPPSSSIRTGFGDAFVSGRALLRSDGKPWTPVSVPWLPSSGVSRRTSEFAKYSPMKICGDLGWVRCMLWEIVTPLLRLAELQSKPAEFDRGRSSFSVTL